MILNLGPSYKNVLGDKVDYTTLVTFPVEERETSEDSCRFSRIVGIHMM